MKQNKKLELLKETLLSEEDEENIILNLPKNDINTHSFNYYKDWNGEFEKLKINKEFIDNKLLGKLNLLSEIFSASDNYNFEMHDAINASAIMSVLTSISCYILLRNIITSNDFITLQIIITAFLGSIDAYSILNILKCRSYRDLNANALISISESIKNEYDIEKKLLK
ncbi:MAG: hypothetical protein RSB41_02505 [Bacilli bacterium]